MKGGKGHHPKRNHAFIAQLSSTVCAPLGNSAIARISSIRTLCVLTLSGALATTSALRRRINSDQARYPRPRNAFLVQSLSTTCVVPTPSATRRASSIRSPCVIELSGATSPRLPPRSPFTAYVPRVRYWPLALSTASCSLGQGL